MTRPHRDRRAARGLPIVVAAIVVVTALGGLAGTAVAQDGGPANETAADREVASELDALASATAGEGPEGEADDAGETNSSQTQELTAAARQGAQNGADLADRRGADVSEAERQAAVEAALRAVNQTQNASVEQVQAASQGAAHGALLQSQSANVSQVQAGVYGGTVGSLTQSQSANVTQMQSASYGGAHGAVAQSQRANVTQIQYAAAGAAAGACEESEDGDDDQSAENETEQAANVTQRQGVTVTQVQESAQGAAYGSLLQRQDVTVRQVQAAAFGSAAGGANGEPADAKKVQEGAMGSAKGALQSQSASVTAIQAAARGGTSGSLYQSQRVSVTQIQSAASGAAGGAVSQYQSASVTQIQYAATGAAQGSLRQVQEVDVVQISKASYGAASGAAATAAQEQIVNVEQIQAAARGAGSGTVIQVQQINVVQIQVIAQSAAGGALSQYQSASVSQIQSAAQGACEGAVSLTQRQEVSITQIQQVTQRAAADTAATAAEIDIDNDVTIVNYARGTAESGDDDAVDEDDDPELRSLFADGRADGVYLANPNDEAVTVTITSGDGDVQTETLSPGEQRTVGLGSGQYALTAETADGEDVEIAGRDRLQLAVGDQELSLTVTVDDRTVTVRNPNDERVTVTALRDGQTADTFDVPSNWDVSRQFDPGTFTLTAERSDGSGVPVEDQDEYQLTVENETDQPGEPGPIDLDATVENDTLSVENAGNASVTATVTDEDGEEQSLDVPAGETVEESFEPGNYTVTGESEENRAVTINDEDEFAFTVEETEPAEPEPEPPIDLNVSAEDGNVSIENANETGVVVTVTDDAGDEQSVDVAAEERVTASLEPGNYTLTGETEAESNRTVLLNGEESFDIAVEAEAEPEGPIGLNASVAAGNLTLDNPSNASVTATVTDEDGDEQSLDAPAGESVTESFDPGNYTVTAESDEDREVLIDGEDEFAFTVEADEEPDAPEAPAPPIDLAVSVEEGNLAVENPNETAVVVTVTDDGGADETVSVDGDENVSQSLEPGNYTLTAETEAESNRTVLLNGEESLELAIEGQPAPEGPIGLNATVADGNLTLENPSNASVIAEVTDEDGDAESLDVPAGESVTESFEPGNYTVTADSDEGREVLIEGEDEFAFTVEETEPEEPEAPAEPIDLNVSAEDGNVTYENPSDEAVVVTATGEDDAEQTVDVDGGESTTQSLDPGNYTVTAETEAESNRSVLLDGEASLDLAVEAEPEPEEPTPEEPAAPIDLNVSVADGAVTFANPSDEAVVVTATTADEDELTLVVDAGTNQTQTFLAGEYTLTAETEAETNRSVRLDGQESYEFAVDGEPEPEEPAAPIDLNATVANGTLSLANPSNASATAEVTDEDGVEQTLDVPAGETVEESFDPGNYTVTATADENRTVTVDGEDEFAFTVEETEPAEPQAPTSLNASLSDGTLTVENPNDVAVTVTLAPDDGEDQTLSVPANESANESLDPGTYTVTAETEDGQQVLVDGETAATFEVEAAEPLDLVVTETTDGVAIENPGEVDATVTATDEDGENVTIDVAAGENVSQDLDPGTYNLSGTADDDRPVTFDGEPFVEVTVAAPIESLETTVADEELTVENPNDLDVTVTLDPADGENQTLAVDAADSNSTALDPGTYDVSAEADDGRVVPVDGEPVATITIEEAATPEPEEPTDTETAEPDEETDEPTEETDEPVEEPDQQEETPEEQEETPEEQEEETPEEQEETPEEQEETPEEQEETPEEQEETPEEQEETPEEQEETPEEQEETPEETDEPDDTPEETPVEPVEPEPPTETEALVG